MVDFTNIRNVINPLNRERNRPNSNLEYPHWISNAGTGEYPPSGFMIFSFKERGKYNEASSTVATVTLFMPEQFSAPVNVLWGKKDTGIALMDNTQEAAGVTAQKLANKAGISPGAMINKFSQQQLGSSASTDDIFEFKSGKHQNPNFKVMFNGVDFRTFMFNFKFTPQNEADCQTVDELIKVFRRAALPNPDPSNKAYLLYPMEVVVEYYWNGQKNQWLHDFKPAVITGLTVDYTSGGRYIAMRNGFASESKLTLTLQETDILVRDDINKGY